MRRLLSGLLAAAALLAGCAATPTQPRNDAMPQAIEQRLREIGRLSAPVETRPLYTPLHGTEPYAGGVNMTYRLAPRHTWPAAQEDIAAAVRWVRQNIASQGGDPRRIFLMGHSAGART